VATVRLSRGADHAYASAVPPLQGASVVPAAGGSTTLHLAAGDQAGSVVVASYAADGRRLGRDPVDVPASSLVVRRLDRATAYAVLIPTAGDVRVVAEHADPGVAVQPAVPLPLTVTRAVVRLRYSDS
jgi:hypothetical protein